MTAPRLRLTLATASPTAPTSEAILRDYMTDVVSRYWGRAITPSELEQAMAESPSDDLELPSGIFVLAAANGKAVGCGGLRLLADGVAEITRVFVVTTMRRRGIAAAIVQYLEQQAADRGRARVQLDTRADLTEARSLYARLGYGEVPRFNDNPYANHWFEKAL